jgi:hypothetical protein
MAFSFFIHGFVTLVFRTRPLKAIIFMVWVLNAAQSWRLTLNPDFLVEMNDNSIEEKSEYSWSDYNRLGMLHLSDRYINSCD